MTETSSDAAAGKRARRLASVRRFGPMAVLAALLLAAPSGFDGYHTSLLSRALALGVLAVSVSILTGFAGLPSLGQAAPFVVGSYTAARLGQAGLTVGVVQVVCAAAAGAVFAAVTGLVVIRTRGVAFLMTTLAVAELTVTAAGQWKSVTGGTDGLYGIPYVRPAWGMREMDTDKPVYWYVLIVAAIALTVAWWVLRSPGGRLLTASRDNEIRMRSAGHPVTGYFFVAYVGAGTLAGIGGALLVAVDQYVAPSDAGFENSALVLLAVVIGGATSFVGALVGAGLIVLTRDWLSGPFPGHGPLVLGLMFVAAVYLLPQGVAGVRLPTLRRTRS
jgi:branched-chain amino acid transport system permease protein